MSKSNYEKYKELKSQFDFEYRGFNMGTVMGSELIRNIYKVNANNLMNSFKNSIKKFDIDIFLNSIYNENIITYTHPREGYIVLCQKNILELNIPKSKYTFTKIDLDGKLKINITHIFKSMQTFFKLKGKKFKDRLYLVSYLVTMKNTIDELLAKNIKVPINYYAFNSSDGLETLITIYFNKKNVNTYSFQHGMYYIFQEPIPIDIINIENFVAKKMLCWGQYSIDEMIRFGINKDRLLLFTNPIYDKVISYKKSFPIKKILLLLSRNQYENGNYELINICKLFGNDILIDIKLHPSLFKQKYDKKINKKINMRILKNDILISDLFHDDYDLVLTYNTTSHYEFLVAGFLTFGYNGDGAILFEEFKSYNGLNKLIKKYHNIEEREIIKKIKIFTNYVIKLSNGENK